MRPFCADPVSLAAAAARIRSMQPGQVTTGILSASGRLVENLAAVLVHDRAAAPACVQRAAERLAAEVLATDRYVSGSGERGEPDGRPPLQRTPFTESIRLGRMG
ncbi:hypothetical protein ACFQH9_28040 [Pseudonocardia lutea]|uniref:Uncharacterized protein n=2 Tax=Pseudonocardia lutea TaxID=2172015 RepID=A0ABW1IEI5_9PSEU